MHKSEEKTPSVFERSLPIVAAALGRLCGVSIEFGSSVPATDGRTIWMPIPGVIDAKAEARILGTLCHECGHVRFTDMKASGAATPFEHALDNALEDVRIEAAMRSLYPGAERFFEAAHAERVKELAQGKDPAENALVALFCLSYAQEHWLRRDWMQCLTQKLTACMLTSFGQKLTDEIAKLALTVQEAASTEDVVEIRRRIMALLMQEAKALKDAGKCQSDGRVKGKAQGKVSKGVSGAIGKVLRSTEPVINPLDLSEGFKHVREGTRPAGTTFDISASMRPVEKFPEEGSQRLRMAQADSVSLRRALSGLVQAKARLGVRICDRGARLSSNHLARLAVSDARVFERRALKRAPNTAVHVLLDMSGSMGYEGGCLALRASLGLIKGLSDIRGVVPALTVFPGDACGRHQSAVCSVLRHGERFSRIRAGEVGSIEAWGGTPLFQALTSAGFQLALRREERRVVIVITDGISADERCRRVISDYAASGIEVMGVQVGDGRALTDLISTADRIDNIDQLQGVLFGFAKKLLS